MSGGATARLVAAAVLAGAVLVQCTGVGVPGFGDHDGLTQHLRENMAVVERVVDGDTVALVGGDRARLLTIDAPELGRAGEGDDECGARAAADELAALLPAGTAVAVNGLKGEPDRDRYGRRLANLYLVDGDTTVNVSLLLVDRGLARVYEDYPTTQTGDARAAQERAQGAHVGIWATC